MYRSVVLGGTFDGLHKGHERILSRAFQEGERVTIGLTSDRFVSQFKANLGIAPFAERKNTLKQWLKGKGWYKRAEIVPLDDSYGLTVPSTAHTPQVRSDFDAIIVSRMTRVTANRVNELRRGAGWKELAIIEVPIVAASDGAPISSTRVRNHEIDAEGHLVMPESLRPVLQQPLGRLIVGEEKIREVITDQRNGILISVGDVATKTMLDAGLVPSLAIIDFLVGRVPFRKHEEALNKLNLPKIHVRSGPGHISKEANDAIRSWGNRAKEGKAASIVLVVEGEEDLLTLPAIAHAPVGSFVYYGQPPMAAWARFVGAEARRACGSVYEGLVEVEVTEEKKREIIALLKEFTS